MNPIKPGGTAPNFVGTDQFGNNINSQNIKTKFIILYFYPKDMTPGCTAQACGMRDNLEKLNDWNATVIGVSKDNIKSHERFTNTFKLNYSLIADEDKKICESYGVLKQRSMFGRKVTSVRRSTFVIHTEDMKILSVIEDANPITHVDDIQKIMNQLNSAS